MEEAQLVLKGGALKKVGCGLKLNPADSEIGAEYPPLTPATGRTCGCRTAPRRSEYPLGSHYSRLPGGWFHIIEH